MTLDLFLVGVVLTFGLIGALTGAARQVAQAVALVVAYYFARPIGEWLGAGKSLGDTGALALGTVVGTFFAAVLLYVGIRMALAWGLRKILRKDGDAAPDRTLGFLFGAIKTTGLLWVLLSAVSFASTYVPLVGNRLPVTVQESAAFSLSRRHNLFEMAQFGPAKDLLALAQAAKAKDAATRKQMAASPAFRSLKEDPRFLEALKARPVQSAVLDGDVSTLLRSDRVVGMLRDPDFRKKLREAADALRDRPAQVPGTARAH